MKFSTPWSCTGPSIPVRLLCRLGLTASLTIGLIGCGDGSPTDEQSQEQAPSDKRASKRERQPGEERRKREPVEQGAASAEALVLRYADAMRQGNRREVIGCFDTSDSISAQAAKLEGAKARTLRLRGIIRENVAKKFGDDAVDRVEARLRSVSEVAARMAPYEQLAATASSVSDSDGENEAGGVILVAVEELPALQLTLWDDGVWLIDASNWFGSVDEAAAATAPLEREVRVLSASSKAARSIDDFDALMRALELIIETDGRTGTDSESAE